MSNYRFSDGCVSIIDVTKTRLRIYSGSKMNSPFILLANDYMLC